MAGSAAQKTMNAHYFMSDKEWKESCNHQDYDYVIIGSSFCALAFTTQVLKHKPDAKILIIEGGEFLLPDHFQNLHPVFAATIEAPSETYPWSISEETLKKSEYVKSQHGVYSFVGGKSSFWSGWCPQPRAKEMAGWPEETVRAVEKNFPKAKELLNVISADQIFQGVTPGDHKPMFHEMQKELLALLKKAELSDICKANLTQVIPAPLAVEAKLQRYDYFSKFCAVGPLLHLLNVSKQNALITSSTNKRPQIQAVTNCRIERIVCNKELAAGLQTSRGHFNLGKAKLILAMGTLPATTLVLNSFPSLRHLVGQRFSAHFMSCITARVPVQNVSEDIELGAVYVSGEHIHSKQQFHIQITAIRDGNPSENAAHRIRHLPDYFASPSLEQLKTSKGYIVFVCACLGELDYQNDTNWFQILEKDKGEGRDITCNATLQVIPHKTDRELWNAMDKSTLCLLEQLAPRGGLEYWHSGEGDNLGGWKNEHPPPKQIRHGGLVHEASTMWISDKDSPVGLDYRLRGTDNVYITGASLWPTAGSWNPVGIIVSMAMDLADKVCK